MPVTIVVGGQYGSEGKGKTVALLARRCREPWVVRCGGPNSGHTTNVAGQEVVLRQLPAAAGQPDAKLFLSAGCVVSEEILIREIKACGLPHDRVVVDARAVLVTEEDILAEQELSESIGSTASGTGHALVRRMLRGSDVRLADDSKLLRQFATVETLAPLLHEYIDDGGPVIVEGTQGFGLSLFHGPGYPFVTARDTTAAGFAMEVGLSPRQIDEVVMVIRTYPIRVGGNSGDLSNELSWDAIRERSGAPRTEIEFTSVTHKVRRIGEFDAPMVRKGALYNRPSFIALMGIDRLDYSCRQLGSGARLPPIVQAFVQKAEVACDAEVRIIGTGPQTNDVFEFERRRRNLLAVQSETSR